jgi:hypothetical protein
MNPEIVDTRPVRSPPTRFEPATGRKPVTIAIPIGWSTNIGNAFFAEGIKYVLERAVPNCRAVLLTDQAAFLNLMPGRKYRHEPRNSLRYLDHIRPDYVVVAGSCLTEQFPRIWGQSFRRLHQAGTKILLIGAGLYDYSAKETELCRDLLKQYPPHVFVSRDRRTFESFHDLSKHSYDGIDCSYFVPEVFQPIETDLPPYVILNFDKTPEPSIRVSAGAVSSASGSSNPSADGSVRFDFKGGEWLLQFPRVRLKLSRLLDKGYAFVVGPLGLHGTRQKQAGEMMIVRTDHALNPLILRRIFRGPNAFAGDLPYTYYNLYAQTELALTDRVHAALVTLSYGRPAMLISRSGRASIIERVGGGDVTRKPTQLDMDVLAREKQGMIEFLSSVPWPSHDRVPGAGPLSGRRNACGCHYEHQVSSSGNT